MIEALPSMGPVITGPGQLVQDGCCFSAKLARSVEKRMKDDKLNAALATDLATAKSELLDRDPICVYRLKVKKAQYRDKVSDEIVETNTLVSEQFGDEAIGVWTDAGENKTGSKKEYRRIIDRANELANIEDKVQMIWASPGEKEHKVYLWQKDRDEVIAYSYTLFGEKSVLSGLMDKLSQKRDKKGKPVEDRTIVIKDNTSFFSHKDVFQSYSCVLGKEEAGNLSEYVEKFRQESELPDSVREEKIKRLQKEYEEKLERAYERDIESAFESVASGMFAISQSTKDALRTKHVLVRKKGRRGLPRFRKRRKEDYLEGEKKLQDAEELVLAIVMLGIVGQSAFFEQKEVKKQAEESEIEGLIQEISGVENFRHPSAQFRVSLQDEKKKEENEFIQKDIVEKLAPALLAFVSCFVEEAALNLDNSKPPEVGSSKDEQTTATEKLHFDEEQTRFAKAMLRLFFSSLQSGEKRRFGQEDGANIIDLKRPTGGLDMYFQDVEKDQSTKKELSEKADISKTDFDKALEVFFSLSPSRSTKESDLEAVFKEDEKSLLAQKEVVELGKLALELFFDQEEDFYENEKEAELFPFAASFKLLDFLLESFEDKNLDQEEKQLVSLLIFYELVLLQNEVFDKDSYPTLPLRLNELVLLHERKKEEVIALVAHICEMFGLDFNIERKAFEDINSFARSIILFFIYVLEIIKKERYSTKNENRISKYSIERLRKLNKLRTKTVYTAKTHQFKNRNGFPKAAVIYPKIQEVVLYRFQPLAIKGIYMTQ